MGQQRGRTRFQSNGTATLLQPCSCRLRAPDAVQDFYSKTPDAVFLLAAALQLEAIPGTRGWRQVASASDCTTSGAALGNRLCATAHRLHNRRAAERARHCTLTAQRKSGGSCAALHTDCTTEEQRIVRGIANGLHSGRAADCSTDHASGADSGSESAPL